MLVNACQRFAQDCNGYAADMKSLRDDQADPELIVMIDEEAKVAERLAAFFRVASNAASAQGEWPKSECLWAVERIRDEFPTRYGDVRIVLGHKYKQPFLTLKDISQKLGNAMVVLGQTYRVWTSRNGKFKIKAKLIRANDDTVTLETDQGKRIVVSIEKLSDADQQFIEAA